MLILHWPLQKVIGATILQKCISAQCPLATSFSLVSSHNSAKPSTINIYLTDLNSQELDLLPPAGPISALPNDVTLTEAGAPISCMK